MNTQIDHLHLFQACKEGDRAAYGQLYAIYAEQLLSYAAARVESLDEAQDLVQDLFVDLWVKRQQIQIKHAVKAYLYAALSRRVLNHYRSNKYREQYSDHLSRMEEQFFFGPDSFIEEQEVKNVIEQAVAKMTPKVREIFLLSREEQLSNKEIAQKLNLSEQTVKNQLSTALRTLRQVLQHAMLFLIHYYTSY